MERIRLLLLVDYVLVRQSLSRQLRLEPDLEIVAECGTAAEGLAAVGSTPSDVVLLDYDAVGGGAEQFICSAREAGYHGRFLVLASEKAYGQPVHVFTRRRVRRISETQLVG